MQSSRSATSCLPLRHSPSRPGPQHGGRRGDHGPPAGERHRRRPRSPQSSESVIVPAPRPPPLYSLNHTLDHPAPVPAYVPELANAIFSTPNFLHLYLAPGHLGVLASPEHAHQNPDVTRPVIILHPGKDYVKLLERIAHAVKSVNPPAWGISDIPPATWEGWGIKLFLPRNGPRRKALHFCPNSCLSV